MNTEQVLDFSVVCCCFNLNINNLNEYYLREIKQSLILNQRQSPQKGRGRDGVSPVYCIKKIITLLKWMSFELFCH